ncbi:MAG TPA: sodium:solute symporter family protein [Tepidisphaeraceae bacterium]|jgi:Na+/proline symporter|nr:sodium:solute symporter family protein [Tepidisphaeraceae bacterium]
MLPAIVIFVYLAVVLYIGIFAFRKGRETGEDFFLASRSIGSIVFFLSLFATNMTAFAILGSSGAAYKQGIGIFGMMATSSALVIPLTLFFIGTRLWSYGKRFGHMTQVSFFRDRWECSFIGTIIFVVTASMLLPYLIISIDGGGTILSSLTDNRISYPVGGAIVTLIVMATVFFGGMRGAVWVNVLQTLLFISFGVIAFTWVGNHMDGGFHGAVSKMLTDPSNHPVNPITHAVIQTPPQAKMGTLLTRERIPWQVFLSFMLIPLSSIMFPHMSIMCFTAKKVTAFKKTVILYPICIAAIWLPCVFLGALGPSQDKVRDLVAANSEPFKEWLEAGAGTNTKGEEVAPDLTAALEKIAAGPARPAGMMAHNKLEGMAPATSRAAEVSEKPPAKPKPNPAAAAAAAARSILADVREDAKRDDKDKKLKATEVAHRIYAIKNPILSKEWNKIANNNSDSVLLEMLKVYVPAGLFGLLAAGIISAVMGSDCHQILALSTMFTKDIFSYYGGGKRLGEKSVVHMGRLFIVLINGTAYFIALGRPPIFDLAVTYAFSGFAALAPMMIAALFWKRSTKFGALACTLWVAGWVIFLVYAEGFHHYRPEAVLWQMGTTKIVFMTAIGKLSFLNFSPVVPMTLGAAAVTVLASLITPAPSAATVARYFPDRKIGSNSGRSAGLAM